MSKIFVLGGAAIFFAFGLLFLLVPVEAFEWAVDQTLTSSSAITDLRAAYGGMSVAIGIMLVMMGMNPATIPMGLISVMVVMLAMAGGRVIGMFVDGGTNTLMVIYLVMEIAAGAFAFALLKTQKTP